MTRSTLRPLLASVVAALALVVAACGGSDSGSSTGSELLGRRSPASQETGGKQGGILKQLGSSDVDYLDPGHTYYTVGYQVVYPTQRPLYCFKPDDATNPVPDLAEGQPEISADGKTLTVKIRTGVKFSPPVNREVTTKDVKYAFERALHRASRRPVRRRTSADIDGAPTRPSKA